MERHTSGSNWPFGDQPNSHPTDSADDADLFAVDDRFEQLSAFIDGELPPHDRPAVEQWLAADDEARALYQSLRRLHEGLGQLPAPPAADTSAFAHSVVDRLEQSSVLPTSVLPMVHWGQFARRCTQVAAGLAIAATGLMVWRWSRPPVLMLSIESPPVDIPELPTQPTVKHRADVYLLEPKPSRDAYAILLADDRWQE